MRSKSKRKIIAEKKTKHSKHNMKQNPNPNYVRRSVTHRASALDLTMKFVMIVMKMKYTMKVLFEMNLTETV